MKQSQATQSQAQQRVGGGGMIAGGDAISANVNETPMQINERSMKIDGNFEDL